MERHEKILLRILSGSSDKDIGFDELCYLLKSLDFDVRIKGSHHIFYRSGVKEIINIQPRDSKAKPYQAKQVRDLKIKYGLGGLQNV